MDIRRKIDELLGKVTSQQALERIYRFIQYVYVHSHTE